MSQTTKGMIEAWRARINSSDEWTDEGKAEHSALCDMALRSLDAGAVREAVWLIERGQEHGQQPALWWVQNEDRPGHPYSGRWTEDANKARKFATRDLAEREGQRYVGHLYGVTEHVFLSAIDRSKINAATQEKHAESKETSPVSASPHGAADGFPVGAQTSTDRVKLGSPVVAAPDVRELVKRLRETADSLIGSARLHAFTIIAAQVVMREAAALLAQPAAAGVSEDSDEQNEGAVETLEQARAAMEGCDDSEWANYLEGLVRKHERHSLAERADRVLLPDSDFYAIRYDDGSWDCRLHMVKKYAQEWAAKEMATDPTLGLLTVVRINFVLAARPKE